MKIKITVSIIFIFLSASVFAQDFANKHKKYIGHIYRESEYQHVWCSLHNGIEEYKNKDFTRVDCLTKTHAVEFDFANKWAESVGQALYYGLMTGKRAKVVLILENPQKQIIYYYRVKKLSQKYDFDVDFVTDEILEK